MLDKAGIKDKVKINYSGAFELATMVAAVRVCVLPEPFVSGHDERHQYSKRVEFDEWNKLTTIK